MATLSYQSSTITDLLDMLVQGNDSLHWNLRCCFADGQGASIMEISFCEGPHRRIKGLITFNAASGKTMNFRYRGYHKKGHDNIVDTLLDLINFEKYQLANV